MGEERERELTKEWEEKRKKEREKIERREER